MDARSSRSRNEGSPPETWNEGSPKAGTSSWTGSWPGSRHGPRSERGGDEGDGLRRGTAYPEMPMSLEGFVAGPNVSTERPMGEGAGASVHDWMFSGWSDAEAE